MPANRSPVTTDSEEGGNGAADNSDSCSSNVVAADLTIDKSCPGNMIAGEPAAYTITVANQGTAGAENVVVIDTLPAGVTFVSAVPVASFLIDGKDPVWELGTITAGGSVVITATVQHMPGFFAQQTNSVAMSSDSLEGGGGVADNTDSCTSNVIWPDLTLDKTCPVDMDGDGIFDTTLPGSKGKGKGKANGPQLSFSMEDTAGCSCAQIIVELELGNGHAKFGCSISAMQDWSAIAGN